jgi:hypothetical protein
MIFTISRLLIAAIVAAELKSFAPDHFARLNERRYLSLIESESILAVRFHSLHISLLAYAFVP